MKGDVRLGEGVLGKKMNVDKGRGGGGQKFRQFCGHHMCMPTYGNITNGYQKKKKWHKSYLEQPSRAVLQFYQCERMCLILTNNIGGGRFTVPMFATTVVKNSRVTTCYHVRLLEAATAQLWVLFPSCILLPRRGGRGRFFPSPTATSARARLHPPPPAPNQPAKERLPRRCNRRRHCH